MGESKIPWTDYTFNPWYGCEKVSPACDHCYAERWGLRTGLMPDWGGPRRQAAETTRANPHRWDRLAKKSGKRARVFALSLGDFFDNRALPAWRTEAWETIRACSSLDWLILTKRPQNIRKMLPPDWGPQGYPNVWLGATMENMIVAKQRLSSLLAVPAAIHWVSAEPLLEPLDLNKWLVPSGQAGLNWIVTGGETGGRERLSDPQWFYSLRNQCQTKGAAFFMKQMTKNAVAPPDLAIHEYPSKHYNNKTL